MPTTPREAITTRTAAPRVAGTRERRAPGNPSSQQHRHAREHHEGTRPESSRDQQEHLGNHPAEDRARRVATRAEVTSRGRPHTAGTDHRTTRSTRRNTTTAPRAEVRHTTAHGRARGRRGKISRSVITRSAAPAVLAEFTLTLSDENTKHRHRDSVGIVGFDRPHPPTGGPAGPAAHPIRNRTPVRSNSCTNGVASNHAGREGIRLIDIGHPSRRLDARHETG